MPEGLGYPLPESLQSALQKIKALQQCPADLFAKPPRIAFISNTLPRFYESSDGFRLYHILKILLLNGCAVDFFYYAQRWNDAKFKKVYQGNIRFRHIPFKHKAWDDVLFRTQADFVWITNLWSVGYFEFAAQLIPEVIDKAPFKLIVDTMDFHYKEFHRKYQKSGCAEDLKLAEKFLTFEKAVYRKADRVVTVSDEEIGHIRTSIDGIKAFAVIPNIHEVCQATRPYGSRSHICFVGNFETPHNADAVAYFIGKIFPQVLERHPDVEFHVLGYGSEKYRKTFQSPGVKVLGSFKHLQKTMSCYRLFVCPMTYGAGVKGKIGSAIEAGVPVVTTPIGAEGFPLTDGKEIFVAGTPADFAEKCNQCLEDVELWHRFSVLSRLALAESYSPGVVSHKLRSILSP
ncbi:MAG: glycosyltransferase family 4 protein [Desulfobacteraceae bacterium]|nr:glycosyltransferase family 4 protein [Desulfobacteraceae bacterium]